MAVINSQGGRAPTKPKVPTPGSPGWKDFTSARWHANHPAAAATPKAAALTPEASAMTAFRAALAQLQSSVPAVDAAAIQAPYAAASTATGQLGTGLQQSLVQSGQASLDQYQKAAAAATQHAAQFGISSGAGANGMARPDNAISEITQQTQAQSAAAPQAAAQWQALLGRIGAQKVSDATLARQGVVDQGRASLAASIPSLIGNERTLAFQKKSENDNVGIAMSQLDEKGKEAYRNFLLDNKKLGIQTDQFDQSSWLKQRGQDITTRGQDMVSADKAASRAVTQRAQQAKQQGLKGIDAVTKAITAPAKSSKTTVPAGWDVTFQVLDPDTGEPTGDTKKINLPDKRKNPDPTAYKFVSAQPATRSKATTSGGGPLTAKQWDTYYRSLRAQNPGKDGAIRAYLGARPKK